MKEDKDSAGRAIYISSTVGQGTLNTLVHWYYKTINEEVCRLAKTSGKIDFSKIFIGGESAGSIASAATLIRANEFIPADQHLGGVFGFIGVVPTLPQNPSVYKTGKNSDIP